MTVPAQHYTCLRSLAGDGRIRSLDMEAAGTLLALRECGLDEDREPGLEGDRTLMELAREGHTGAFLSLRCRSSWPLEEAVKGMHIKYKAYGLELIELAAFALDDVGRPYSYLKDGSARSGRVPFPVEVVRSWDPARAGLPHWARRQLEHRNDLKRYLREQGVLLIGPWALLADSSATQVRQAMELTPLKTLLSLEQAVDLHRRYLPLYRLAKLEHRRVTGRQRGWQPDDHFLQQLEPEWSPQQTRESLDFMAGALRHLLSGQWQREERHVLGEEGTDRLETVAAAEPSPMELMDEGPAAVDLEQRVSSALREAGEAYLRTMLEQIPPSEREQQLCFWCAWSQGASTRQIAERCGAAQARVSRRMDVKRRSGQIATQALALLRADPEFRDVFRSAERLEVAAEGLANHLQRPEQEGGEPPLCQLLRSVMEHQSISCLEECIPGARP